jgi:hypothetical protein
MSWAVGYDTNWRRDIGYGVPCKCDYPGCDEEINRGLSYVCGGLPYGGDRGCGLYFCDKHMQMHEDGFQACEHCAAGDEKLFDAKPDVREWIEWKLSDESWARWRDDNPKEVERLRAALSEAEGER